MVVLCTMSATAAAQVAGAPGVVLPLAELVGGGHNMKQVKDCTELCLAERGIDRLHGFELLVNLEVLWLNGNRLRAVDHLDANVRLKELYVHDNQLCTLKGSLHHLKFLEHLDLGNNSLGDLAKVLRQLERLRFLRHLNLQGNPCCEEPDYRLHVVYHVPWLEVLDWHQVTDAERRRAKEAIGGSGASLTVAFGRRAPSESSSCLISGKHAAGGPAAGGMTSAAAAPWRQRAPERSPPEQELMETAARVLEARREAEEREEREAYARNPDAGFWAIRELLPPPPGLEAAWGTARQQQPAGPQQPGAAAAAAAVESGAIAGKQCWARDGAPWRQQCGGVGGGAAAARRPTAAAGQHGAMQVMPASPAKRNLLGATGAASSGSMAMWPEVCYVGSDVFVLQRHFATGSGHSKPARG